ncbi:sensor histidine kinase [Falsiroseomonas sp.]|uniref:sensor histidine kinase n=1 Tax=Falsiroseomonas sp. TaxID=2870721 RepID=UPI003564E85A
MTIFAVQRGATARRPPGVPVRLYVLCITLAAVLPLLGLAALLAVRFVAAETERFERAVRDSTFAAALAVERDLSASIAVLRALATSQALQSGNLAAFHEQARAVRDVLGANVILRSPRGRQLVSTFYAWGETLPARSSLLPWDPQVLSSGQPVVTGHYVGITGGVHSYAIVVPVKRDGEIAWLLHASFDTRRLRDILLAARVPEGAQVAILDSQRVILARRELHEQAVGGTAEVPRETDDETVWRRTSRSGQEVFAALRRLPSAGWYVGVGVPVATVLVPLRGALWTAAAAGGALLALALAGAWFFGRHLARTIGALTAYGEALEGGQPATPPESAVREVNEVGDALAAAATRHKLMLHELNHRVRNTLAMVDALVRLTARHAKGVPDYEARLSERIRALAQTHVLLAGTHGAGAALAEVLRSELAAHDTGRAGRLRLDGPPVTLAARQAASFGMLVHELTTNATKYGALSRSEGRIAVAWRVEPPATGDGLPQLVLDWVESGGPPVMPPRRRGFGTALIERALARDLGATVTADYAPEGLRFRLVMPLPASPGAAAAPGSASGAALACPLAPELGSSAAAP